MADQIDIMPLVGRQWLGMTGSKPILGDEQRQPIDIVLLNGRQVATTPQRAAGVITITLGADLSPAECYAIQIAVAKHNRTTILKPISGAFNRGHKQSKSDRSAIDKVRKTLRDQYLQRF